jgi:hypothetical protein
MNVILSKAKDLSVGTRVYCCELNAIEVMMIEGGLKILRSNERSLAALGMTNGETKDPTNQ